MMTPFRSLLSKPLLLGAVLLGSLAAHAQGPFTGKPRYQIQARRQGAVLGNIVVELFPTIAPHHVSNWDSLVAYQFFDSTAFHRVVPGFVIQGGDPNSRHGPRSTWGYGQPNQPTVNAEFNAVSHERGVLSAARDNNINSASSQFFICVAAARSLNGQYTAYGKVVSGIGVVDQIVGAPRDANDNPLLKIEMFVTRIGSNDSIPDQPALVYPGVNAEGVPESPRLSWRKVRDAMIYHVQVASDSLFTNLIEDKATSQLDTTATITGLLPPLTTYYWRVEADNGGRLSGFSPTRRFRTGIAAPTLVAPANNANNILNNPLLEWSAAPMATSYRFQIANGRLFLPNQIVLDVANVSGTSYQINPGLALNYRYYWRVMGVVGTATGFWSQAWNFRPTIATGTPAELAEAGALAQNVPNPALQETTIRYTLPQAGAVRLTVLDLLGREVLPPVVAAHQAAGEHTAPLSVRGLAPGVYLYRLEAAGRVLTRRMAVGQ